MRTVRNIRMVQKSKPTTEGAGVRLHRAFGFNEVPRFDPFLMLDDFRSDDPADFIKGFPWHPHRGIETITYVLKGDVEHGDSMGNRGVISSGDVQWMTAGSGIIHQEMPKGDPRGSMHGFQLWANLPASHKMMDPRYRGVTSDMISEVELDGGGRAKIIAGTVHGVTGPVEGIVINPEFLDCSVPDGASYVHTTNPGYAAFIYVIGGRGVANDTPVDNRTLVLFDRGDEFTVRGEGEAIRFLLLTGKPLKEPVAWYGPIVMNTDEELETAFSEYREGTFVKKTGAN